jgi:hypothetical protein
MNERAIVICIGIGIVGYHVVNFTIEQNSKPVIHVMTRNTSMESFIDTNYSNWENITSNNDTSMDNDNNTWNSSSSSSESPLNDQTVYWDTEMFRPWLQSTTNQDDYPPAMLLITNYAWNHPNQSYAIQQYRGIRSAELYEGIVNHIWFHPRGWEEIQSGNSPCLLLMKNVNVTRCYLFLDFETCMEKNYPRYGHGHFVNRDTSAAAGNRGMELPNQREYFQRLLFQEPMLWNLSNLVIVVWDCRGLGPSRFHQALRQDAPNPQKPRLSMISLSTTTYQAHSYDQGLPPPYVFFSTLLLFLLLRTNSQPIFCYYIILQF